MQRTIKTALQRTFTIAPVNYDFNTTTMASFFCWEKEQAQDARIASRFLKASRQDFKPRRNSIAGLRARTD
jgi:hypothetical protein